MRRAPRVGEMRYRRVTTQFVSLRSLPELSDLLEAGSGRPLIGPARWRPPADVYETRDAITVNVDLAGVEEDDFDMQLYPDVLVVEGVRHPKVSAQDALYHLAEIRQGRFRLEIRLSARVDQDAIEGRYDRGLLTITLPKTSTITAATAVSEREPGR